MVLPAELLWSYVPGFLASRFLARPMPVDAPGVERFLAAVLFADISGFTPLAERLARRGPTGAEALSNLLNAYFAELMSLIASVEAKSEHPMADAVVRYAKDHQLTTHPVDHFESITGRGATGLVRGTTVAIGNESLMKDRVKFSS